MADLYLVAVSPGALDKLQARIERTGGVVTSKDPMSSTLRVKGMTRRELSDLPGVVYIRGDGQVPD
jgi:hypothetical protein